MSFQTFPASAPERDILAALDADGACIVEDLISQELCDALMNDFMPHIEAAEWTNAADGDSADEFFGFRTKRFHGLPSLSPKCAEIIGHPLLLSLASEFLGRGTHCRALRISTMELMVLGQGQANQQLHRDLDSWPYIPRSSKQRLLFSANIALSDFTESNGATVVVPGSHKWDDNRKAVEGESCLAIMRKGSALLYSGEVVHGGREWGHAELHLLSGLENHAVINNADALARFNKRVRHLLGVTESGFEVIP